MLQKKDFKPEGNKGVGVGQGYEGVGLARKKFFSASTNPLLHMELRPCNNSPFISPPLKKASEPDR
jgi:hypothetical protein